jgi:hypothetical protein
MRLFMLSTAVLALLARSRTTASASLSARGVDAVRSASANRHMAECVEGHLEDIAGDTHAEKFTNTRDDGYRISYQVIDGGAVIQDTATIVVAAHSTNVSGTIHCSPNASIQILSEEKI